MSAPDQILAELQALRAQNASLLAIVQQQQTLIERLTATPSATATPQATVTLTWGELFDAYDAAQSKRHWWPKFRSALQPAKAHFGAKRVMETRAVDWTSWADVAMKDRAPSYRNLLFKKWRAALRWAKEPHVELLPESYVHPWERMRLEEQDPPRDSEPSDDDLTEMLRYATPLFRVFILIAIKTGMRRAENLSLRWDWIDWDERVARVPARAAKGKKKHRVVPLPLVVLEALRDLPRMIGCPYVYAHTAPGRRQGKRLTLDWATESWRRLADRVGMVPQDGDPSVRLHDCRAKTLNDLLRNGVPLATAMRICGWRSMSAVQRYLRVSDDDIERARTAIDHGAAVFKQRTSMPRVGPGTVRSPNTDTA